jgi:hypothetical protein
MENLAARMPELLRDVRMIEIEHKKQIALSTAQIAESKARMDLKSAEVFLALSTAIQPMVDWAKAQMKAADETKMDVVPSRCSIISHLQTRSVSFLCNVPDSTSPAPLSHYFHVKNAPIVDLNLNSHISDLDIGVVLWAGKPAGHEARHQIWALSVQQ